MVDMETLASAYAQTLLSAIESDHHGCIPHDGQLISHTLDELPSLMSQAGMTKPFVVVDNTAIHAARLNGSLLALLDGMHPVYFDRFSPNPTSEDAAEASRTAAINGCDGIVAIGGGSCCDVAKVAALCGNQPELIEEFAKGLGLERARPLPLIAAPTTAGTGSETTHFAAIYVNGRKVSIAHERLRPMGVILDERFQHAMPTSVAACSGLDALCQAMESTWAVGSTDVSLAYAREAGRMIGQNLVMSVLHADRDARRAMMIGSHLAGKAINISKTTAAHALSYQLTQACGVAHGHAVALMLGEIARWNASTVAADCLDPRGPEWVVDRVHDACGYLGSNPDDVAGMFAELLARMGLERSIAELDLPDSMLKLFASRVDPVRAGNNPRRLDETSALECLERAKGHAGVV